MARILIAEDDPQASEIITRICEFKGHEVEEACDAVQALAAFHKFSPDLVITDLAMPLGGGQYLVREMRSGAQGTTCPVIVITGYAGLLSSDEREALQPCTVLAKPLELDPLLDAISAALEPSHSADGSPSA
jgi:DNA-binding response OmpR family regulator